LLSAGWTGGLAVPVGFFSRRRLATAAAVTVVVLGALLLPPLVGLTPTSVLEWLGLGVGLAGGAVSAVALRGRRRPASADGAPPLGSA
jgi:hypothetical protein